jgi:hypothetical protein
VTGRARLSQTQGEAVPHVDHRGDLIDARVGVTTTTAVTAARRIAGARRSSSLSIATDANERPFGSRARGVVLASLGAADAGSQTFFSHAPQQGLAGRLSLHLALLP